MEIRTKEELQLFIKADLMMNRGKFSWRLTDRLRHIANPDWIMSYLEAMRKYSYYRHGNTSRLAKPMKAYWRRKYGRLGVKLGFSIGEDTLGYGVVIPHYGTIVVGGSNRIGNFAVLHTSTCISANGKVIGNGLYLATGAKMTSKIVLGNNVSVGANSLVNKSIEGDNILIGGMPAVKIKDAPAWYIRSDEDYDKRVQKINDLISEQYKGLFIT
jgi:serine O-acetyltransferase